MWLGRPRTTAAIALDGWGAATLPLNGCACLVMPPPAPWERLSGRPAQGLLATRGADVVNHRRRHAGGARPAGPNRARRGRLRHAGSHRSGAAGTLRRLGRIQPRRPRDLARQPRRLHCRADSRWGAPARRLRPTTDSTEAPPMLCRTACCSWFWRSRPAAPCRHNRRPVTVRITSPVDDGFVSGLFRLVAVIEPGAATQADQGSHLFRRRPQICTLSA